MSNKKLEIKAKELPDNEEVDKELKSLNYHKDGDPMSANIYSEGFKACYYWLRNELTINKDEI